MFVAFDSLSDTDRIALVSFSYLEYRFQWRKQNKKHNPTFKRYNEYC